MSAWNWAESPPPSEFTYEQTQTASRLAREAIDARGVACTCGAWTTIAPAWHQPWCEREREEAREFERALAKVRAQEVKS